MNLNLNKMEVADKLYNEELEIAVEHRDYHPDYSTETCVYLSREQIALLRDHLTKVLDNHS